VKVEVQLFATLGVFLPAGARGDSVTLEVPPGTTVGSVIERLRIPPALDAVVVVNGRDADRNQILAEGDVLAMFPPLAGG
jgi:molybdopterin converting factor small subunit